jgi:hypothetical protein
VRTLTLVNGRRFIPANSQGSVDLATIPTALVERVEIITGGASAVYGSDAIAGAVNFLLRDNFEGLQVSTQYGETSESDGRQVQYDALFGSNFDEGRGNVTVYASHAKRDPVFMQDRDFSRVPLNAALGPSGSGNIPGGRVSLSAAQIASLNVGGGPGVIPVGAEGCTTPVSSIRFGANGQVLRHCDPETLYNYAAGNYLLRPLERTQFSGLAHYEINEAAEAYAEVHYALAENEFQQAADSLAIVTGSNPYFEVSELRDQPGALAGGARHVRQQSADLRSGRRRQCAHLRRHFAARRRAGTAQFRLRAQHDRHHARLARRFRDGRAHLALGRVRAVPALAHRRGGSQHHVTGTAVAGPEFHHQFCRPGRVRHCGVRLRARESLRHRFHLARGGGLHFARALILRQVRALGRGCIARRRIPQAAGRSDLRRGRLRVPLGRLRVPAWSDRPGEGVRLRLPRHHRGRLRRLRVLRRSARAAAQRSAARQRARAGGCDPLFGLFEHRLGRDLARRARMGPVEWLRFRGAYNVAIRAPNISELFAPIQEGFSPGNDPCAAVRSPSQAQKDFCVQQACPRQRSTTSCRRHSASVRCPAAIRT